MQVGNLSLDIVFFNSSFISLTYDAILFLFV